MASRWGRSAGPKERSIVDRNALMMAAAMAAAVLALLYAMTSVDGPASRCEGAGGQMLVGPGGETSCVDSRTFVPLE